MPSSSIVHTKSQGRGIGKSLVEYVKNKYENIELAVYKDNKKAVEFYKKQGFKIIKRARKRRFRSFRIFNVIF